MLAVASTDGSNRISLRAEANHTSAGNSALPTCAGGAHLRSFSPSPCAHRSDGPVAIFRVPSFRFWARAATPGRCVILMAHDFQPTCPGGCDLGSLAIRRFWLGWARPERLRHIPSALGSITPTLMKAVRQVHWCALPNATRRLPFSATVVMTDARKLHGSWTGWGRGFPRLSSITAPLKSDLLRNDAIRYKISCVVGSLMESCGAIPWTGSSCVS